MVTKLLQKKGIICRVAINIRRIWDRGDSLDSWCPATIQQEDLETVCCCQTRQDGGPNPRDPGGGQLEEYTVDKDPSSHGEWSPPAAFREAFDRFLRAACAISY